MFIDDHMCLASYNVFGEGDGSQLPQLLVGKPAREQRETSSFYYAFWHYYETLWRQAVESEWDFEEYLS